MKRCRIGDTIQFMRKGKTFKGTVKQVRETSVLVEISQKAAVILALENQLTVVAHKNCEVIQ
jgi:uncharacterized protein YkvS